MTSLIVCAYIGGGAAYIGVGAAFARSDWVYKFAPLPDELSEEQRRRLEYKRWKFANGRSRAFQLALAAFQAVYLGLVWPLFIVIVAIVLVARPSRGLRGRRALTRLWAAMRHGRVVP